MNAKLVAEWIALRELLATADPTVRQKVERDRLIYGTGYMRQFPDGTVEHIPALEVITSTRDPS